jgi:hypothetical protein
MEGPWGGNAEREGKGLQEEPPFSVLVSAEVTKEY